MELLKWLLSSILQHCHTEIVRYQSVFLNIPQQIVQNKIESCKLFSKKVSFLSFDWLLNTPLSFLQPKV